MHTWLVITKRGRGGTYVVFIRINSFCVEALLALLFILLDMLRDPYIPVQPQYQINPAREGVEMGFQAADEDGGYSR